jgi:hypothetical protein
MAGVVGAVEGKSAGADTESLAAETGWPRDLSSRDMLILRDLRVSRLSHSDLTMINLTDVAFTRLSLRGDA